jgi:hypothetical protein
VNLTVTDEPRCVSRNAKTLVLQHLQLSDMAASSGLPDGAYMIHHRADELFVKQHTVSDGKVTSVREGGSMPNL